MISYSMSKSPASAERPIRELCVETNVLPKLPAYYTSILVFAQNTHTPTCLVAQMLGHYNKFTGKN